MLVDATAKRLMFFIDGFNGYNQIKMNSSDAKKIIFWTPIVNFHYIVTPFGLKNARAAYQRAMTATFHDMLHDSVEDYINDIIVKSKEVSQHIDDLKKVFWRCGLYNLWMNPLKCVFGISFRKILGFIIHRKRIGFDPTKAKAIQDMRPPKTVKELKSSMGSLLCTKIRFSPGRAH